MTTRRILVVDPDDSVRTAVAAQLAAENFTVDEAADAADALAQIAVTPPDLVVLDLSGPRRDDLDLPGPRREDLDLSGPSREDLDLPSSGRDGLDLSGLSRDGLGSSARGRDGLGSSARGREGLDPGRDGLHPSGPDRDGRYWSAPGRVGLDTLIALRSLPVIVLGDRSTELDRITALDLGADDYMTKPFSPRELAARARSVLRRAAPAAPEILEYGRLRIDLMARSVDVAGRPVDLTAREFDLLAFLASTPRHTFSRSQLLAEVWSSATRWQLEATVTEHMYRLRHKLESLPGGARWLRTVRNVGYLFDPGSERA